jgi:hypothetical protein
MIRIRTGTSFVYSKLLPELVEPGGGMYVQAKSHLKKIQKISVKLLSPLLAEGSGDLFYPIEVVLKNRR